MLHILSPHTNDKKKRLPTSMAYAIRLDVHFEHEFQAYNSETLSHYASH